MSARNGFGGARAAISRTQSAARSRRGGTAPFARLGRQRRGLKGPALVHAAQPAFGRRRRRRIGGLGGANPRRGFWVDGRPWSPTFGEDGPSLRAESAGSASRGGGPTK